MRLSRPRLLAPCRRQLLALALVFSGFVAAPPLLAQDEPGFVAGIEDLPLMPGLREDKDAGTVFDSADGRIVEAYASGAVDPEAVLAFYAETLPQLGWSRETANRFSRADETLSIAVDEGADGPIVHFSLSPR